MPSKEEISDREEKEYKASSQRSKKAFEGQENPYDP